MPEIMKLKMNPLRLMSLEELKKYRKKLYFEWRHEGKEDYLYYITLMSNIRAAEQEITRRKHNA